MVEYPIFDVFLAHNSTDKPQVRAIASELRQRGLNPWLDEEQMRPGDTPLEEIQKGISQSKCVVFFIGLEGSGKWQGNLELPITVDLVINSGLRLIPVLLPGVNEIPKSPQYLFMRTKIWINFESLDDREAFKNLVGSISGESGVGSASTTDPSSQATASSLPGLKFEEFELSSEKGVDYSNLRDLLAKGNWREADEETGKVMCQACDREKDGWLRYEDVYRFPITDLHTIDKLWMKYSDGRFGFSVQQSIWEGLGEKISYEAECCLAEQIGWIRDDKWLSYKKLIFSKYAPKGHLPGPRYIDNAPWYSYGISGLANEENLRGKDRRGFEVHFLSCKKLLEYEKEIKVKKNIGVNYTKLKNLLANQEWKKADYETAIVMLNLVDRTLEEGWLSSDDINNFPCEDLRYINQLWLHYTYGLFAFSIQKKIYSSLGGTEEYDENIWSNFAEHVGWFRKSAKFLNFKKELVTVPYENMTFNLNAPKGHFPFCGWLIIGYYGGRDEPGQSWCSGVSSFVSKLEMTL
ncbi:MAG: GUN4 domain-containing protein [Xenococcus sp. (in: cyanobacteria)]